MRYCFRSVVVVVVVVVGCAGGDDGVFLFPYRCGRRFLPLILVGIADEVSFGAGFFLVLVPVGLGVRVQALGLRLLFSFCLLLGVVLGWCLFLLAVAAAVLAVLQAEGTLSCYRVLG